MEEVEQFDNISIEDLAEGMRPCPNYYIRIGVDRSELYIHRTPRERTSLCRALLRTQARRWANLLPPHLSQLGTSIVRDESIDLARECIPRLPSHRT